MTTKIDMIIEKYLTESKTVYNNPDGETAFVEKDGKGFYAEIDNKYDMDFENKKELNQWIKKGKWKKVGME